MQRNRFWTNQPGGIVFDARRLNIFSAHRKKSASLLSHSIGHRAEKSHSAMLQNGEAHRLFRSEWITASTLHFEFRKMHGLYRRTTYIPREFDFDWEITRL